MALLPLIISLQLKADLRNKTEHIYYYSGQFYFECIFSKSIFAKNI